MGHAPAPTQSAFLTKILPALLAVVCGLSAAFLFMEGLDRAEKWLSIAATLSTASGFWWTQTRGQSTGSSSPRTRVPFGYSRAGWLVGAGLFVVTFLCGIYGFRTLDSGRKSPSSAPRVTAPSSAHDRLDPTGRADPTTPGSVRALSDVTPSTESVGWQEESCTTGGIHFPQAMTLSTNGKVPAQVIYVSAPPGFGRLTGTIGLDEQEPKPNQKVRVYIQSGPTRNGQTDKPFNQEIVYGRSAPIDIVIKPGQFLRIQASASGLRRVCLANMELHP